MHALMVDALGSGKGTRLLTRDVIGAGPRWICGIMERRGIDCRIELGEDFLRGRSIPNGTDVLLVSAMTMDIPALRKIGRLSRKTDEILKIVGGPICGDPIRALKASGFDLAVVGEGEKAVEAILMGEDPNRVLGVALKNGSEIVVNPAGATLDQMQYNEYLPSIARVVDYPAYFASRVYVEVVRGCSNFNRTTIPLSDGRVCSKCSEGCGLPYCPEGIPPGCGFCSVPSTFGPPKSREISLIEEEITGLVQLGVRRVVLSAPDILDYFRGRDLRDPHNPPPNYGKLGELLEASVSAAGSAYVSIENVKPSLFDDEAARTIAKFLPSSEVHIGCETGDQQHSTSLGRPSTPAETLRAVRIARKWGLKPYVYFIYGLPGQSTESAQKTVELIGRMEPYVEKITTYRFRPLPGSAFEAEHPGATRRDDEASRMISEATRKVNLKKKASYIGRVMETVVAERNFQRRGEVICFPTRGGPIVTLPGSGRLIGKRVKVRIGGAVSDRLLSGTLEEVLAG